MTKTIAYSRNYQTQITLAGVSSPAELKGAALEAFYTNKKPYRTKRQKIAAKQHAYKNKNGSWTSPTVTREYHKTAGMHG